MRSRPALLAAAIGAALLAPAALSVHVLPVAQLLGGAPASGAPGASAGVRADELLAAAEGCDAVSDGMYRSDDETPADIPVCGGHGAVHWTADLDIDCDGPPGRHCNESTDPYFSPATAFHASDGSSFSAETLPYVVVPAPSALWDHREHGIGGGSVAAVVHGGKVTYAVVGDAGPAGIIGEASYAAAAALDIPADPRGGGVSSGVTYIVFEHSRVPAAEDHEATAAEGERLARDFVRRSRRG